MKQAQLAILAIAIAIVVLKGLYFIMMGEPFNG